MARCITIGPSFGKEVWVGALNLRSRQRTTGIEWSGQQVGNSASTGTAKIPQRRHIWRSMFFFVGAHRLYESGKNSSHFLLLRSRDCNRMDNLAQRPDHFLMLEDISALQMMTFNPTMHGEYNAISSPHWGLPEIRQSYKRLCSGLKIPYCLRSTF